MAVDDINRQRIIPGMMNFEETSSQKKAAEKKNSN